MKIYKQYKGEEGSVEVTLEEAVEKLEKNGFWKDGAIEAIRKETIESGEDEFNMDSSYAIYGFREIKD